MRLGQDLLCAAKGQTKGSPCRGAGAGVQVDSHSVSLLANPPTLPGGFVSRGARAASRPPLASTATRRRLRPSRLWKCSGSRVENCWGSVEISYGRRLTHDLRSLKPPLQAKARSTQEVQELVRCA